MQLRTTVIYMFSVFFISIQEQSLMPWQYMIASKQS